jgi:hypothetical protein
MAWAIIKVLISLLKEKLSSRPTYEFVNKSVPKCSILRTKFQNDFLAVLPMQTTLAGGAPSL